jgi:DNA polymerase-3 subunit beta
MEIQVQRLRSILRLLEHGVAKKTTLPITQSVLFRPGEAVTTDLSNFITVRALEADQRMSVGFAALQGAVRNLNGLATVRITMEDGLMVIREGATTYRITATRPDEFPPSPDFTPMVQASMDGDALVVNLAAVRPYAATEDSRPVLHGVCMDFSDHVQAAGADGFRLAVAQLPRTVPVPEGAAGAIIIPVEAVDTFRRLWAASPKPPSPSGPGLANLAVARRLVAFAHDGGRLRLQWGDVTLLCALIQGSFPNFRQLIPTDHASSVMVDAGEFRAALNRVAQIAGDGAGLVRLRWDNGALTLSARAEEVGEAETSVSATVTGQPGRIAFSWRYLAEYVADLTGAFELKTSTPSSPGLFLHPRRPIIVIMPMFVQWDGGQPAEVPEADAAGADGAAERPESPEPPASDLPSTAKAEKPQGRKRKRVVA